MSATQPSSTPQPTQGQPLGQQKSHEELVREYVKAARAKLAATVGPRNVEAAQQSTSQAPEQPPQPPPQDQPTYDPPPQQQPTYAPPPQQQQQPSYVPPPPQQPAHVPPTQPTYAPPPHQQPPSYVHPPPPQTYTQPSADSSWHQHTQQNIQYSPELRQVHFASDASRLAAAPSPTSQWPLPTPKSNERPPRISPSQSRIPRLTPGSPRSPPGSFHPPPGRAHPGVRPPQQRHPHGDPSGRGPQQARSPRSPQWSPIPPPLNPGGGRRLMGSYRAPTPAGYVPPANIHNPASPQSDQQSFLMPNSPPAAPPPSSRGMSMMSYGSSRYSDQTESTAHYSQMSNTAGPVVEPIQEESESLMSSRSAMSTPNQPDGRVQTFYHDASRVQSPEGEAYANSGIYSGGESIQIARQASVQTQKPTLTHIRSSDSMRDKIKPEHFQQGAPAIILTSAADQVPKTPPNQAPVGHVSPESKGTIKSNSSEDSSMSRSHIGFQHSQSGSPLVAAQSRYMSGTDRESRYAGGRSLDPSDANDGADNETRASTTSLGELIKRALRLASNLERGDTSSKFGTEWFGSSSKEKTGTTTPPFQLNPQHNGSSPHVAGQVRPSVLRGNSNMNQSAMQGSSRGEYNTSKEKKRCCGMRMSHFIMIIVLLMLIIAAAIIIPLCLIVIPNEDSSGSPASTASTTPPSDVARCQKELPCSNGGISVPTATLSCECLCANGFTGKQCTREDNSGCATADMAGIENATVGSAVVPIINNAESDFNIPLNASIVLSLFSAANLDCNAENALVTFNSLSTRSTKGIKAVRFPYKIVRRVEKRQVIRRQVVGTTNGIIVAQTSPGSEPPSIPTSTPTGPNGPDATSSSSSSGESFDPQSSETLDFARTAVLYLLQDSRSTDTAEQAQINLQAYFSQPFGGGLDPTAITLADGWTANLVTRVLENGSGDVVGGDDDGGDGSGENQPPEQSPPPTTTTPTATKR